MANSLWERSDLNAPAKDSASKFLSKALGDGDSMVLTLVGITQKVRGEETKIGKPGDQYFEVEMRDEDGKDRTMEQNSNKGTFMKALRLADIDLDDKFMITRAGIGIETTYQAMKMSADGLPVPPKDEIGF
jgi:hypothetical protein